MSRRPQVEEIESSEDETGNDSDPSIDDPTDFAPLRPSTVQRAPQIPNPSLISPADIPGNAQISPSQYKHFATLYPVYFDAARKRASGRRVKKSLAVHNPLAHTLAQACSSLGLNTVYEPHKFHPKDWANPGRVKVDMGTANVPRIHLSTVVQSNVGTKITKANGKGPLCKRHLYALIGHYLVKHPTRFDDPLRATPMPGLDLPSGNEVTQPTKPKGWIMGDILPLHSPALSGGPINEDMFKDVLGQMAQGGGMGQLGNAMGAMSGMRGGESVASGSRDGKGGGAKKTRS